MKLTDISTIRQLFEKHGFSFTKSLGQNFLINPTVCPKIAEMGGAGKNVGSDKGACGALRKGRSY